MNSLREYVAAARRDKSAIGHFNVSTIDGIWAVADAAKNLNVPVIIGLSEGERDYFGVRQAVAVVKSIREERDQAIFINADHTYSFERVREAVDAGYDAIIYDGAQQSFDDNIRMTVKCVEYARAAGRDILVEGELGYIGTSSKVLDRIPDGAVTDEKSMTDPREAAEFVERTGVDLLAPAVGNIHGVVRGGDPSLNVGRVMEISRSLDIPLVLHGASGNSADDVRQCVKNGMAIVHVNTELRLAYRAGLVKSLSDNHEEISPYKYLKPAKLAMQKVVEEKIKIICQVE